MENAKEKIKEIEREKADLENTLKEVSEKINSNFYELTDAKCHNREELQKEQNDLLYKFYRITKGIEHLNSLWKKHMCLYINKKEA